MMKSMHFSAELDQGPESKSERPPLPKLRVKTTLVHHQLMSEDYTRDDGGRFLLIARRGDLNSVDQTKTWVENIEHLSFDGDVYRFFDASANEAGAGSIFPKDAPFDWSKPLIKPTFYMDHLFNPLLAKILHDK